MALCPMRVSVRVAAVLVLLAPASASAQATGTISGLVTDSTDAALRDVALEVTNRATGLSRRAKSNDLDLERRPSPSGSRRMGRSLGCPPRDRGRQSRDQTRTSRRSARSAAPTQGGKRARKSARRTGRSTGKSVKSDVRCAARFAKARGAGEAALADPLGPTVCMWDRGEASARQPAFADISAVARSAKVVGGRIPPRSLSGSRDCERVRDHTASRSMISSMRAASVAWTTCGTLAGISTIV
jgi:hypothetical protein